MDVNASTETSKNLLNGVIGDLKTDERTITSLSDNGFLFLEHDLPYLVIYRKSKADLATLRLARSCASYVIIDDANLDFYKKFLLELTEKMSTKFGGFLLIEIYSGEIGDHRFHIKGPAHKLPASLKKLKSNLEQIDSRRQHLKLTADIENTKERQDSYDDALFSVDDLKDIGGTLVGIEIPPVYKNADGNVYPVYFRTFRNQFNEAIQQAIFEFVRVQTNCQLPSYNALGKRDIHDEVFKIDRQLTEIQSSYQFLLLVAPVNIQALRKTFFETNFKDINKYRYRLLPVDPDLLKRQLYNLRIDEIDDPALSFLFDEKREEIDQQLTMLKERGSKNFFYSSVRLYKGIEKHILAEAKLILQNIPEKTDEHPADLIDAHAFKELAKDEFNFFKAQDDSFDCKVHIRDDVNIIMVSQGELYLPSDYKLTRTDAKALIQHEIGTHALTYYNGKQQSLSQMAVGFADYDPLQEGIAVLSEYFIGGLSGNRLRILAGRVVAGEALLDGADFKYVFNLLYSEYGFTKERAFNITSRMFQGGGFLKDIIYLKGLVHAKEYLEQGESLEALLSGKFALKHVDIIDELTERGLLMPPMLKPRYLKTKAFDDKLDAIKKGISISKMIDE